MRFTPCLCLVVLAVFSSSSPTSTDYRITGTVRYGPGLPLEGAHVAALDVASAETLAVGLTDAAGTFDLTLPVGTAVDVPPPEAQTYRIDALYPQPVQGGMRLQVHYAAPPFEKAPPVPELFDVTGRQISPEEARSAGVYFLRLRFASGKHTPVRRFIQTVRGAPEMVLHRTASPASTAGAAPPAGAHKQGALAREIRLHITHPKFVPYEEVLSLDSETPVHLEAVLAPATALLTPAATQPENLLFAVTAPPDLEAYYYGIQQEDTLQLTHLLLQEGEQLHGLVFNETHYPIQWIGDSVTVAVRRLHEDDYNAARTFLSMVYQSVEDTLTLDLSDLPLSDVLSRFEDVADQTFPEARALVDAFPAWSLDSLASWAMLPGKEQASLLAAGTAFRTAHAAWRLQEAADTLLAPGKQLYGQALAAAAKYLAQVAAASLAHVIEREVGPGNPNDPGEELPELPVLLCRGAAKYGLCHYLFFRYLGSTAPCVSFCSTSLRCFTDICQPKTLDMQRALALRASY